MVYMYKSTETIGYFLDWNS